VPEDSDGERIRDAWLEVDPHSDTSLSEFARRVSADVSLWGVDLATLNGFADVVAEHLVRIVRHGIHSALDAHLTEPATT